VNVPSDPEWPKFLTSDGGSESQCKVLATDLGTRLFRIISPSITSYITFPGLQAVSSLFSPLAPHDMWGTAGFSRPCWCLAPNTIGTQLLRDPYSDLSFQEMCEMRCLMPEPCF
jgi:hypothetical protein